ncbi:MAG: AAA family ATPase [Polaromonas sp.]|nr:AAA family ATPase [Polaromonas sp.]
MKPSAIRQALPRLLAKNRAAMLWGAPGVGKSDLVASVAADMKIELRDVRLSMLDPVDLKGFPTISTNKKQMSWLPADFLPTKGKGILFLDEINHAPQAVQAPAFQLVLNRKLGDYELPVGWSVMAAGNRASDRSIAHAMPAALANRFVHLDYDVNVEDWNNWAMESGIHTDIRAFIRFRPNLLHSFDAASNPRAFPSPRSWSFVNDIYKDHLSQDTEFELIKGTIGEGASAEFSGFVRLIKDLPTVDAVLLDPQKTRLPESPAAQYALATALDAKTTVGNITRVMQYMERMPVEFQVLFMRSAIRRDDKLTGTKSFADWGVKHANVLC